jgi:hypothetical protein
MPEIETFNKFMVGSGRDGVVIGGAIPRKLTAEDALLLAVYLVCMAELHTDMRFTDVLKAVENA